MKLNLNEQEATQLADLNFQHINALTIIVNTTTEYSETDIKLFKDMLKVALDLIKSLSFILQQKEIK